MFSTMTIWKNAYKSQFGGTTYSQRRILQNRNKGTKVAYLHLLTQLQA